VQDSPDTAVYTIGYGQRRGADVIDLLQRYGIEYLVDVRSTPYSRFRPEFSRPALEKALPALGVRYVFMGDLLGGRPSDPTCYRDGKVDYTALSRTPAYQHGIQRLKKAWMQGLRVCLLCSEARPEDCHRTKLIGQSLAEQGIPVRHIDADGSAVDHDLVMRRLTGGQQSLFGVAFTSRKRYQVKESDPE